MNRLNIRGWLVFALSLLGGGALSQAGVAPPKPGSERLLIVAPAVFLPALEGFVAHKRTLRPTEWRPLESILERSEGVDDPEKLKRFLYQEWRERGLGCVLLVGDVDVLPVRLLTSAATRAVSRVR